MLGQTFQDKCTEIGYLPYDVMVISKNFFSLFTLDQPHQTSIKRHDSCTYQVNRIPFTLGDNEESLCCLSSDIERKLLSSSICPSAGYSSAGDVCSSLCTRVNGRRAQTMGSTPAKENMESRFTFLLSYLHNERRADRRFLSDLFFHVTLEISILSLLWKPGKRLTELHGCLQTCSWNYKEDRSCM